MIFFLDSEALESVTGSGSDSDLQSRQVPTVSGCVRCGFTIPAAESQLLLLHFWDFFPCFSSMVPQIHCSRLTKYNTQRSKFSFEI